MERLEEPPRRPPTRDELRRRALKAARAELHRLHGCGLIGDEALQQVEDDLRRLELKAFLGRLYADDGRG